MEITKSEFGRFVMERRRSAGFTQRDLAERLHVTESAVSKWERGLSFPDITLVNRLAGELGVTGGELIAAGEDVAVRRDVKEARTYRRWRGALLWTTLTLYAITVLTCFIVNLAVDHTLTWFWVVLSAVALAFCLTTLPLLPVPKPGWSTLLGSVLSLGALLLVVWLGYAPGAWLPITCTAILFGLILVFVPILLRDRQLPGELQKHRMVLALAIDTLALFALLLVIFVATDRVELFLSRVLAIAAIGIAPMWSIALVIRYLPVNGLGKAAVVVAFSGGIAYAIQPAIDRLLGEAPESLRFDFTQWNASTISANVQFLVLLGALLIAAGLSIAATVRARRTRAESRISAV